MCIPRAGIVPLSPRQRVGGRRAPRLASNAAKAAIPSPFATRAALTRDIGFAGTVSIARQEVASRRALQTRRFAARGSRSTRLRSAQIPDRRLMGARLVHKINAQPLEVLTNRISKKWLPCQPPAKDRSAPQTRALLALERTGVAERNVTESYSDPGCILTNVCRGHRTTRRAAACHAC